MDGNSSVICSGIGQYQNSDYSRLTLQDIRALVDDPQSVDKAKAQWLIPSTLMSRTFKEQEAKGEYWYLWADIDENPPTIKHLSALLSEHFKCDFEVYTSRSAKADYQKSRIIIPLQNSICGADWVLIQENLSNWLASHKITPDRAAQGAAQLCYLPNRGDYYESDSKRGGVYFDPLVFFKEAIAEKKLAIAQSKQEVREKREAAKLKREQRTATGFESPIDEFKLLYPVEEILVQAGYDQRGDKFRHPNSKSGNYKASVKDGRVHSFSRSDPLFIDGKGAHDSFSAFTVLSHNGDRNAAIKDAGDNWLLINGDPWNEVKQSGYDNVTFDADYIPDDEDLAAIDKPLSILERIKAMDITSQADAILEKLDDDVFLLEKLVLMNQITYFFAPPNSGKTLLTTRFLMDAAKKGDVDPTKVIYVNADDNPRGAATKAKVLGESGIMMLVPGNNGFKCDDLYPMLEALIKAKEAQGVVVVIDTLRRFFDSMDNQSVRKFGQVSLEFKNNGGTLLVLGHTNKNRDKMTGKRSFEGTQGTVNDADTVYVMDVATTNYGLDGKKQTVTFDSSVEAGGKVRGDNADTASYSFTKNLGDSYLDLLASVAPVNDGDVKRDRIDSQKAELLEVNAEAIEAIADAIKEKYVQTEALLNFAHKHSQISKPKLKKVLMAHTGDDFVKGDRWKRIKGEKRAINYELLCLW